MRRVICLLFCLCLGLPLVAGCGPDEVPGTVLKEVPHVAGDDQPYKMPALEDASTVDAHAHQGHK